MSFQNYTNHWSDKAEFREKIEEDLYPQLEVYHGKKLTNELLDEIKKVIAQWLVNIQDGTLFDCEIKIDVDNENVKFVNVSPID